MTLKEECRNEKKVAFCAMSKEAREYLRTVPINVLQWVDGKWSDEQPVGAKFFDGMIFREAPKPPPFTREQRKAMANELGQVWAYVSPEVRVLIREAIRRYNAPAQWLSNTDGWKSLDVINPDNLVNLAFRIPLTWEPTGVQ